MRKYLYQGFAMSLLALLLLLGGGGDKAAQHPAMREMYSAEALREDFEQLMRIIKKNHPALYDFTGKEEYERLIKQQSKKINKPLPINDFYKILLPLVTKIGCGHSGLELFEVIKQDSSVTVLPLRMVFQQGSGYVLTDHRSNSQLTAGTEIIAINGKAIPALLQQLEKYICTDGNNASHKRGRLNVVRFNALLSMEENFPKAYTIRYRHTKKDSIRQIVIPAMRAQHFYQVYEAMAKRDSLLQFSLDPAKKVALLTVKSFGFYNRLDEFKRFIDDSFNQIVQANIDHLILDVRYNWGGDPFCSAYLFTYLARKPVPYFAQSYPTYEQLAQPLPLAENRFRGKVYVLTNGFCFSSTGHLCALLKFHQLGEFIGTETHGTYTCNDNSQTFHLTHTGLMVNMARRTYQVATQGLPRFRGICPDYEVEPTLADLLAGRDRLKEVALKRVEELFNNPLKH